MTHKKIINVYNLMKSAKISNLLVNNVLKMPLVISTKSNATKALFKVTKKEMNVLKMKKFKIMLKGYYITLMNF